MPKNYGSEIEMSWQKNILMAPANEVLYTLNTEVVRINIRIVYNNHLRDAGIGTLSSDHSGMLPLTYTH
jgi:hypothetical protein